MLIRLLHIKAHDMKCFDFKKAINRYADGEMAETDKVAMQQHADECPACRHRLREIQRLSTVLATDHVPDMPLGFVDAVMRRARAIEKPQRGETISFLPAGWRAMTRPVKIAAAAMLVMSMGLGALMGWDASASQTRKPSLGAAKPDLVVQSSLDYFAETPAGSLARVYLALAE